MIWSLGRQGPADTLGQHCPQMTQRRRSTKAQQARLFEYLDKGREGGKKQGGDGPRAQRAEVSL